MPLPFEEWKLLQKSQRLQKQNEMGQVLKTDITSRKQYEQEWEELPKVVAEQQWFMAHASQDSQGEEYEVVVMKACELRERENRLAKYEKIPLAEQYRSHQQSKIEHDTASRPTSSSSSIISRGRTKGSNRSRTRRGSSLARLAKGIKDLVLSSRREQEDSPMMECVSSNQIRRETEAREQEEFSARDREHNLLKEDHCRNYRGQPKFEVDGAGRECLSMKSSARSTKVDTGGWLGRSDSKKTPGRSDSKKASGRSSSRKAPERSNSKKTSERSNNTYTLERSSSRSRSEWSHDKRKAESCNDMRRPERSHSKPRPERYTGNSEPRESSTIEELPVHRNIGLADWRSHEKVVSQVRWHVNQLFSNHMDQARRTLKQAENLNSFQRMALIADLSRMFDQQFSALLRSLDIDPRHDQFFRETSVRVDEAWLEHILEEMYG